MKMSEIGIEDIKEYCRVESGEEDNLFSVILDAGKQFIMSQTGMTAEECDEKADLTIALLLICSDLYENRVYSMTTGKTINVNPAADAIISQYCMNIL